MKRYDAYKSTSIPWIPEVPEHWEVDKIRKHFKQRVEMVSDKDYPPLSVTKDGILPQLDTAVKTLYGDKRKLVLQGDYVVNSRSDRKGSCGISQFDGSVSLINIVMPSMDGEQGYYHLLFRSNDFIEEFYRNGRGIVADLWTTRYQEMKNIEIPFPPLSEQRAIVAYIERKERQIDTYIARQAEQIERLKELRKTIISHAVTRGIHPYTRFRPTGIPWIPEVPEHWECVELKRVTVFNPSRKENIDGDTLVGYAPMEIVRSNMESCLTIKVCKLTAGLTYFEEGDVVLAKVTPCFENGNVAIIPRMIHYCGFGSSELFVYRCKDKLAPKLLFYYFQSAGFVSAGTASMTGTGGLKRVSPVFARNAKIPLPPLSEQRAIVAYIEKKTAAADRMINACHKQTELMKAYKQRLISDAVTGRINVLPHD